MINADNGSQEYVTDYMLRSQFFWLEINANSKVIFVGSSANVWIGVLEFFINNKEDDIPRPHSCKRGEESLVKSQNSFCSSLRIK